MSATPLQARLADASLPVAPQYVRSLLRQAGTLAARTADGSSRCQQCAMRDGLPAQCTAPRTTAPRTTAHHAHSYAVPA